jgi:hypothetical protein
MVQCDVHKLLAATLVFSLVAIGSGRTRVHARRTDPRSILLKGETINVHSAQPMHEEVMRRRSGHAQERTFMVHMEDAGDEEHRRAVREAAGKELDRYLPHNTFLLDLSPAALMRTQTLVGASVVWMGELQPRHKRAADAIKKLDDLLHESALAAQNGGGARASKATNDPGEKAAPLHAVLVAKLRSPTAADLAPHYERELMLAGFAVTVVAVAPSKLHVKRLKTHSSPHARARIKTQRDKTHTPASDERLHAARESWAQDVAQWLSEEHEVQWVEPKARVKVLNKYAAMTVQGGFKDGETPCLPCGRTLTGCPSCAQTGRTPIWNMGLKGEGEVVGCGDTGMDVDSCFFWHSGASAADHPGPPFAPTVSATHRKIVSYKAGGGTGTGDAGDGVRGHGTHVVGSIAGAVDASFTPGGDVTDHGGMAPAAKIAFFDLDNAGQGLDIPDDLVTDYYKWAYDAGARIHTNSWGDDSNDYTLITAETDQFVFENQVYIYVCRYIRAV